MNTEIPDKVFDETNTPLWRVQAVVVDLSSEDYVTDFRWEAPVPVYSGARLVGSAVLERKGMRVLASLVLDYNLPERLDAENREPIWALPRVTFRNFVTIREADTGALWQAPTIADITALELRGDCATDLPPLGAAAL